MHGGPEVVHIPTLGRCSHHEFENRTKFLGSLVPHKWPNSTIPNRACTFYKQHSNEFFMKLPKPLFKERRDELIILRIHTSMHIHPDMINTIKLHIIQNRNRHYGIGCDCTSIPKGLPLELHKYVIFFSKAMIEEMGIIYVNAYSSGDMAIHYFDNIFNHQHKRIWLYEPDFRYSGDFGEMLTDVVNHSKDLPDIHFKGRYVTSGYQIGIEADLITFGPIKVEDNGWTWNECVSNWDIHFPDQKSGLIVLVGVSRLMIDTYLFYVTQLGRVGFLELMMPSIAYAERLKTVNFQNSPQGEYICCDRLKAEASYKEWIKGKKCASPTWWHPVKA